MKSQQGLTLIELCIGLAIISLVTAIAIPLYQGYVTSSREAVAAQNLKTLQMFQENYAVEYGSYRAGIYNAPKGQDTLSGFLGWQPDNDQYQYAVTSCASATIAQCYQITVTAIDGDGNALTGVSPVIFTSTPAP